MDCMDCQFAIYDLLDRSLSAADEQIVRAHLDGCPDCRRFLEAEQLRMARLPGALALASRQATVPADAAEQVRRRLGGASRRPVFLRRLPDPRWLVMAASLLVAAGTAVTWWSDDVSPAAASAITVLRRDQARGVVLPGQFPGVVQVADGLLAFRLPSGVAVTLQGPASLVVHDAMRLSLSQGRLVAVVPRQARGFIAEAPGLTVRDLGTVFGLATQPEGSDLLVFQGEVEASDAAGNRVARCRRGEGVRMPFAAEPMRVAWHEVDDVWADSQAASPAGAVDAAVFAGLRRVLDDGVYTALTDDGAGAVAANRVAAVAPVPVLWVSHGAPVLQWKTGAGGGSGTWKAKDAPAWWNGSKNVAWPDGGVNNNALFAGRAGEVVIAPEGVAVDELLVTTKDYTLRGGPITLTGASPTIAVNHGRSTTKIESVILGSGGLTKVGPATLQLRGANKYAGDTRVLQGNLLIGAADNRLPIGTRLILGDGATGGGTFQMNSRNQRVAGLLAVGRGVSRVINSSGRRCMLTVSLSDPAAENVFGGCLGGPDPFDDNFDLVKRGPGRLTLTGTNTFTGNIAVQDGILRITCAAALGTGAKCVELNAAAVDKVLELDGSAGDIVLPQPIAFRTSGHRGVIRNVAGNNAIHGLMLLTVGNGNTRLIGDGGTLTLAGEIVASSKMRMLELDGDSNDVNVFAGVLARKNEPGMIKSGQGTWLLTGRIDSVGQTTLNAGTLTVAGAGRLGRGPLLLAGGVLDLGETEQRVSEVTVDGDAALKVSVNPDGSGGRLIVAGRVAANKLRIQIANPGELSAARTYTLVTSGQGAIEGTPELCGLAFPWEVKNTGDAITLATARGTLFMAF